MLKISLKVPIVVAKISVGHEASLPTSILTSKCPRTRTSDCLLFKKIFIFKNQVTTKHRSSVVLSALQFDRI